MKKTLLFMLLALFAVTTSNAQQNEKKAKIEFVERTRDVYHEVAKTCGEGNGTPLQYSCLENPMDGGAW